MDIGIEILGLTARYSRDARTPPVLNDLSLRLGLGTVGVVVGPSGAGKTTLMNCVAGLHDYEAGSITLAADHRHGAIQHTPDRPLTAVERRRMGIAFQQSHLWSNLSVRDNLVHPQVWLKKVPRKQAQARADQLLASLELEAQAHARVTDLSGGQRQRVAILRALALSPDVLLLDEITASQDPQNVQRIFDLVRSYVAETGCTALTISHDMEFVRRIADTVLMLEGGGIAASVARADLEAGRLPPPLARFMSAF